MCDTAVEGLPQQETGTTTTDDLGRRPALDVVTEGQLFSPLGLDQESSRFVRVVNRGETAMGIADVAFYSAHSASGASLPGYEDAPFRLDDFALSSAVEHATDEAQWVVEPGEHLSFSVWFTPGWDRGRPARPDRAPVVSPQRPLAAG